MLRVGLTGGIASGKSLVADIFVELGAALVDADVVARDVVEPGSSALATIGARFGTDLIGADGRLDRRRLRQMIFSDPAKRQELEALLHPLIREQLLEGAKRANGPYVVIAVPLLVESGFAALVDRVVVVDCPQALQLERLIKRDQISDAEARSMLEAQLDRETRLKSADDVIDNGGDIASTRRQVERLDKRYRAFDRNC
jgi:dephospho-CoA kinase